jgi:hypothetical protein
MKKPWIQAAAATLVLTVLQASLSFLVPASGRGGAGSLPLLLLSNAMTASLLVWIARRLRAHGWAARAAVLWAVWGGIMALSLVEAALFDIRIPPGDLPWLTAHGLAVSACFALFLAGAVRAEPDTMPAPASLPPSPWWRLAACSLLYVALYFAAGTLAYPYLREFYEARPMPSMAAVIAVQPFRGLAFAVIVLLLVRQLRMSRLQVSTVAALTMSVVGGVAPLIIPNPYLPDAVRYAHLPEVGVSNFLFGFVAAWLLAGPSHERARDETVALSA